MNKSKYLIYQVGLACLMACIVIGGEMYHSVMATQVQSSYLATMELKRKVDTVFVITKSIDTKKRNNNYKKSYAKVESNENVSISKYARKPETVNHFTNRKENSTPTERKNAYQEQKPKSAKKFIQVELNTASAEELTAVYGIGEVFSKRIVKYRDILGGFANSNQLIEVYGMADVDISNMRKQLTCSGHVKQININTADFKTLIRHPYLSKNDVKLILNYLKKHKEILNMKTLEKVIPGFNKMNDLLPYIDFQSKQPSTALAASN